MERAQGFTDLVDFLITGPIVAGGQPLIGQIP